MIELIPRHKIGLSLSSPVLIAAGFGGYGDILQQMVDLSQFGAVVTRAITLRPRRVRARVAELSNGFLIDTGHQNPGVKKILRRYAANTSKAGARSRSWATLPLPVIPHLPADTPDDLARTARAVAENALIAALELGLPAFGYPDDAYDWVMAVRHATELPLLVKIPMDTTGEHLNAIAQAGGDALVVSAPPRGSVYHRSPDQLVSGEYYGPAVHPQVLNEVCRVVNETDLPVVACGGIHSLDDARAFLACGARAVQLDAIIFINPQLAADIASRLRHNTEDRHGVPNNDSPS
jgi:dihydroorotate dehydrogenase (NAD+) catalytic subunit